ncbi:MAG: aminotransferase class IV family protein [Candidatus Omnitrophica bacterium]|nr:aminotransferase class IV family protein [Candidatus Omnitrophota bacterium]
MPSGLFETMRISRGRIPLLDRHLKRLCGGWIALGFSPLPPKDELRAAAVQRVSESNIEEGVLRLIATGGEGKSAAWEFRVQEGIAYTSEHYSQGVGAALVPAQRDESSKLCRYKTLDYFGDYLARRQARERGVFEGLLQNSRGFLAEGSVSNLFVVKNGCVKTPPLEDGALPGIARSLVVEKIVEWGWDYAKESLLLSDVLDADEAFLTNAVMGVMPLVQLEGQRIGNGAPGVKTKEQMECYSSLLF